MFIARLRHLRKLTEGLFSVDWFVLTAVVLGFAVVVIASIQAGPDGLVYNLASYFTG